MLISVGLDARWVDTPAAALGAAVAKLDRAGVDLLVFGAAAPGLDPMISVAWLAPKVKSLGLVAAVPALHSFPYHVARALSAVDFLTKGGAGWAPFTLGHATQAPGIGAHAVINEAQALAKAVDFFDATLSLWDGWDADALIIDQATGVYLDASRTRRGDYRGVYFQVMGPLNAARPPQGHPVLVQSDADPLWRDLAARADVLLVEGADEATLSARRREITDAGGQARILAAFDPDQAGDLSAMLARSQTGFDEGVLDGVHLNLSGPDAVETAIAALSPILRDAATAPRTGSLRARLGLADQTNSGFADKASIAARA